MNWLRKHLGTILCALIFIVGACLLAYPTFSNWWNQRHQSMAISAYNMAVEATDTAAIEEMLTAAEAYNDQLQEDRSNGSVTLNRLTDEQDTEYRSLLTTDSTGIMGYIRIPKIDVELAIYHGTSESVLHDAVGHLEGSSLPIGGKGTHAVLSGHRGLPSARLFTRLDSLGIGDVFMITCLGRKITYEVDQIVTVLPTELDELAIDPDMDYCTLVTCTPYGINTHRLLVRGHRIDNLLDEDIKTIEVDVPEHELSDQERIQQYLPYIFILAGGFFGLALLLPGKKRTEQDLQDLRRERGPRRRDRSRDRRRTRRRRPRTAEDEAWEERWQAMEERRRRRMETPEDDIYDEPQDIPYDNGRLDDGYEDSTPMDGGDDIQDDIEFYDADDELYDED